MAEPAYTHVVNVLTISLQIAVWPKILDKEKETHT